MGKFLVSLENVRFFAYHGFFESENMTGNEFEVNLTVEYSEKDMDTEELNNTVSYADLYALVREEMERTRKLLETLAREIVISVKEKYPFIEKISCKVTKIAPPIGGFIGSASVCYRLP